MIKLCDRCYAPLTGIGARVAAHACLPVMPAARSIAAGIVRPAEYPPPGRPSLLDRADVAPDWSW